MMSGPHCRRAEWAPGMPPEYCKGVWAAALKSLGACAILLTSHRAINNNELWETAVNGWQAWWGKRTAERRVRGHANEQRCAPDIPLMGACC